MKLASFLSLFSILIILYCVKDTNQILLESQRNFLLELYVSTNGGSWRHNTNWNEGDPCEDNWYGVECDDSMTSIVRLELGANFLDGTLPNSIGDLLDLQLLYLHRNGLRGTIPESLVSTSVTQISFDDNQLEGNLPEGLCSLSNLLFFTVNKNNLSGTLMESIGGCNKLINFGISGNHFYGQIPDVFSGLINLKEFNADNNNFDGTIPHSLTSIGGLMFLKLENNTFVGDIPNNIEQLENIIELNLSYNQLTGTIPEGIGYYQHILELHLESNKLTGLIPKTLRQYNLRESTTLPHAFLDNNNFDCPLPHFCTSETFHCGECTEAGCCTVHENPECEHYSVTACVCDVHMSCCTDGWTQLCVDTIESNNCGFCNSDHITILPESSTSDYTSYTEPEPTPSPTQAPSHLPTPTVTPYPSKIYFYSSKIDLPTVTSDYYNDEDNDDGDDNESYHLSIIILLGFLAALCVLLALASVFIYLVFKYVKENQNYMLMRSGNDNFDLDEDF
eukprot:TRINITY_DN14508_c0_g1_i1.p1 TRINITY_DN14508_c0_g1~~TRINITY_DN14508_c0_g1_i1.p1  ORF type:complete len:506 (-),score=137.87 TRINITY_DN14508_c0_g1_i1:156-1673(-)